MFIPPGEIIHESLATSYVLVDSLVADLCEGGFSGVVEVVLRDTDTFIVISNGIVAGALEKRSGGRAGRSTPSTYGRTTVEELSERSRLERGRLSIYGYPSATASAIARRVNAQPLYVGLSTEFTQLGKMISKLVREQEREWFIEILTQSGPTALIQIHNGNCRIIGSAGSTDCGALDLASNPTLGYLIDECNQGGGTFDVYFTQDAAAAVGSFAQTSNERVLVPPEKKLIAGEEPAETQLSSPDLTAGGLATNKVPVESLGEPLQLALEDECETHLEGPEQREVPAAVAAVAGSQSGFSPTPEPAAPLQSEEIEPEAGDLSLVLDEFQPAGAAGDAMAEVKRLMGEIARAIEEAAQLVGRPDSFSMSLRAGQLEIADRFPFLDPFAGEFEYLSGEIVFVGEADAEKFVEGLTEALKRAIGGVAKSSAHADRFRSYVREDLLKLHARERSEIARFGLEEVIQQLISC